MTGAISISRRDIEAHAAWRAVRSGAPGANDSTGSFFGGGTLQRPLAMAASEEAVILVRRAQLA
jgi:hypothetical protein